MNSMKRDIGLHLRLTDTLMALAERALALDISVLQCFFLHQESGRIVRPSAQEIAAFRQIRGSFNRLFLHASYLTNLAGTDETVSLRIAKMELDIARALGFHDIILHSGCAKGSVNLMEGIDRLVRRLNELIAYAGDLRIVLENTAHAGYSIGSDLQDFTVILAKLDKPEKVGFCIDTAHAHAYGYPLVEQGDSERLIAKIDEAIGIERLVLMHLNNTFGSAGSCIDRHALLHEGSIPIEHLKSFVLHEKIKHLPIIMELPAVHDEIERAQLELVRSWH